MVADENGRLTQVGELCAGQYFGEAGIASNQPRNAHVIAREGLSCLIFSPQKEANFAGRGQSAALKFEPKRGSIKDNVAAVVVDTSEFVMAKVSAIAAHRTQCPISSDMFPRNIWNRLFGKEYFVCRYSANPAFSLV